MKRGTPDHPKTKHLARTLNVNRSWAIGILESLWHWSSKFAPQGDIGRHQDIDISEAVYWDKDPSILITALIETGWIDRSDEYRLVIHDWEDHADEAVRKYLARHKLTFRPCRDTVETESRHCRPTPPDHAAMAMAMAEAKAYTDNTVELPVGFPKTKEEAIAASSVIACPCDFVEKVWNAAMGRNGLDAKGIPILRFSNWLSAQWSYEQNRLSQEKHATHIGNSPKSVSRNTGTYNEGISHLYRNAAVKGVPNVPGVPDTQRPASPKNGG